MNTTFLKTAEAVHKLLSKENPATQEEREIVGDFVEALKRKTRSEMTSFTSALHEDDSPEGCLRRSLIYNYGGVVFWELESFATEKTYSLPPSGSEKRKALIAFAEAWCLFAKWRERAVKQSGAILAATKISTPRQEHD